MGRRTVHLCHRLSRFPQRQQQWRQRVQLVHKHHHNLRFHRLDRRADNLPPLPPRNDLPQRSLLPPLPHTSPTILRLVFTNHHGFGDTDKWLLRLCAQQVEYFGFLGLLHYHSYFLGALVWAQGVEPELEVVDRDRGGGCVEWKGCC